MRNWRSERWEAKRRRSNAQSTISVLHDASCAHLERLLGAHGLALREHPIAVDRKGLTHGDTHLWRSGDLFGEPPTFAALRTADFWPQVIFDVVTATKEGKLITAFEVVAFSPPSARKRVLLAKLGVSVYLAEARDVLALTPECPWLPLAFKTPRTIPLGFPFTALNPSAKHRGVVVQQFDKLMGV